MWISGTCGALQENLAFHFEHGVLNPELAIIMDMSDGAKINGMDHHIVETVKRWITYCMPEGDAIGVAQIGTSNFVHLPMTVVGDMSQRRSLASKIKIIVHGESNPLKGIHLAEKMFSKDGGLIVLLSYKEWEEVYIGTNEKRTLSNALEKNLKVVNIFLKTNTSMCAFCKHNSYAQFLHMSENSLYVQHQMRMVNVDTALEEIMAVYSYDWGNNYVSTTVVLQKNILIDKKLDHKTNISTTVFTCSQFRRLEISVHLLCGSMCHMSHDLPECIEAWSGTDTELNMLWISYPCNVTGTWTLSLTCLTTNDVPNVGNAFIRVTEICAFEEGRSEKAVKFKCIACNDGKTQGWSGNQLELEDSLCKQGESRVNFNDVGSQPVIFMSQIEESNQPMENVTIMVTIEDVSYLRNISKSETEKIKLQNGWAADGINKDKIHYGYFAPSGDFYNHCQNNSESCIFSLTCTARGNGHLIGNFEIQTRGPPFQITDEPSPPVKIRDLKGEQEGTSSNIKLTWTAGGRSRGNGKVQEYTLQLKEDCKNSTLITNGLQEDYIYENRRDEGIIYFQLPSTPGELSSYSVALENIFPKTRLLHDLQVCFFLEAIEESLKKTPSNCACTTIKYKSDGLNPPGKIKDLRGEQEGTTFNIMLTWTATGKSLGNGKALEYALQFKNECRDNSSTTNGDQEDEIDENITKKSIEFKLLSTPGELSNYSVTLLDAVGKTRLSQDLEVCFFLEVTGESQNKTLSNCACTTVKYVSNYSNVDWISLPVWILLLLAFLVLIVIYILVRRRKFRGRYSVPQRESGNTLDDSVHYYKPVDQSQGDE